MLLHFLLYKMTCVTVAAEMAKKDHQNLPPSAVFLSETPFPAVRASAPSAC